MKTRKILVLNGPNLDMLGTREPEIYGHETLADLEEQVRRYGESQGVGIACYQSNSEGVLISKIHSTVGEFDGIVYNPGAHTHYSYALRDAIASIDVPVVEVHISDVDNREEFRRHSVIAPVCVARVKALGVKGYCCAVDILLRNEGFACLGEGFERVAPDRRILLGTDVVLSEVSDALADSKSSSGLHAASALKEAPARDEGAPLDEAPVPDVAPAAGEAPVAVEVPGSDEPSAPGIMATLHASAVPVVPATPDDLPSPGEVTPHEGESAPDEALAPVETPVADEAQAADGEASSGEAAVPDDSSVTRAIPVLGAMEASQLPAIDYTAPFADAVAAGDAGRRSFNRQTAVRNECARVGIRGLLVRDTSNIRWVTAFDDVFDEERAHALLIADGRAALHTDTRYSNAVRKAASRIGSNVAVTDERMSHARFAHAELAPSDFEASHAKLGMEDTITYAEFVKMVEHFSAANLAPTTELVLSLRAVKDRSEVARLKAAQAVTDAAFSHIITYIRPGMTEREVQLELEDFMVRHGAEGLAFSSIVATGANGADPHAIPGKTRLEAGQCVVLDFGAVAYGYCSDMTRTVFLGEPDGEMAVAWNTLRRANETVEGLLRPGITGAAAHQAAERVLEDGGFGGKMGHGLGHGVGIDVHELPVLNPHNDAPLVEGNVVTVEPGIYLPGKFGMRLEDFGIVTPSGFEVFTQSTHEMVVV